jgi:hypothetical protein
MTKRIPQGWLSVLEAIQLVVRCKYPGQDHRTEGEAAWIEICYLAYAKDIRALILTASDKTVEADHAQFAGLQTRYLFQLTEFRGVWPGDTDETGEPRETVLELEPQDEFAGKDGRVYPGQLCFNEEDLQSAFDTGGEGEETRSLPPKKTGVTLVDAIATWLRKNYPDRPSMKIEELMRIVKKEARDIGAFGIRTFQSALAKAYPQRQSAKFRKVPQSSVMRKFADDII